MGNLIKSIVVLQILLVWCCNAYNITRITRPVQHAKSPEWCPKRRELIYVDSFTSTIHIHPLGKGAHRSYELPTRSSINFCLFKEHNDKSDTFLMFSENDIDYGRRYFKSKVLTHKPFLSLVAENPEIEFNAGKVDSKGRIWAGTVSRKHRLSVNPKKGSLYMIDKDLVFHQKLSNLSFSNGMAWNKKNTKFYFIDSDTKVILEYDYDEDSGKLENKKTLLNTSKKDLPGKPFGMTIDEDDNLWVALFGGSMVIKVDSKSGDVKEKIEMPVTYVTSVLWGDKDYKTLFVTTSKLDLSKDELKDEKDAGAVFGITDLDTKGVKPHDFKLKSLHVE